MAVQFYTGYEIDFLINITFSLVAGIIIGIEKSIRGKVTGMSTHSFIIGGAMLFTFISSLVDPLSTTRIAAGIVAGIGFLGAGIIMKEQGGKIMNVTTASSIWFSAAIGMAIGFGWYAIAAGSVIFAVVVARLPQVHDLRNHKNKIKQHFNK